MNLVILTRNALILSLRQVFDKIDDKNMGLMTRKPQPRRTIWGGSRQSDDRQTQGASHRHYLRRKAPFLKGASSRTAGLLEPANLAATQCPCCIDETGGRDVVKCQTQTIGECPVPSV